MLRLKRQPSDKVAITLRERTSPSKRLVGKGFAYSLFFHLLMALIFQIRITYFENSLSHPTPTVFLDNEESAIAILTDMKNGDEDPRARFVRDLHLTNTTLASDITSVHGQYAQALPTLHRIPEKKREFLPIVNLPWSFSDSFAPSHHICRVYPLKIMLHQNLRSLHLTDDGSRLFRKASFETLFYTTAFSETHPQVEFKVEVAAASGKILKSACLRELLDKRLQGIALHIVKSLRFSPCKESIEPTITGVLTLQFSGTFDTISTLLDTEQTHD